MGRAWACEYQGLPAGRTGQALEESSLAFLLATQGGGGNMPYALQGEPPPGAWAGAGLQDPDFSPPGKEVAETMAGQPH